ncbi:MAG: hydantoinase/oxoprolinase family protein [archaeon]|nr:hydantoinase/oxoprolinase family protein [archaeon]
MTQYSKYDKWVQDWILQEKHAGRKCFSVKKSGNNYCVYFQTIRYNRETKKREKVFGYIGKLTKDAGLIESDTYSEDHEYVSPVRYGLGIDTGGTFTDAVIVDLDDYSVIAKKKSRTIHEDLSIGLYKSIDAVFASTDVRPSDIATVGISTTLATNSILENRGGEVGLILIGWNPIEEVNFGEKKHVFIKGGYDSRGKPIAAMSKNEVIAAIREVSDGVDAIAISGLFANVNPSQEKKVKELAIQITGLPTVAGHELSAVLGIDMRAETAVLNAKLIPVVTKFFDDVEKTFKEKNITAPIMAYKGDGSVMTLKQARQYPVETILSGPAASCMGGKILSDQSNCVVVDIGGTSTDIAIMENGFPQIQFEGATIGEWKTRVKAVDIHTIALGGDSRIRLNSGTFEIGPERVTPLSEFANGRKDIVDKIMHTDIYDYYEAINDFNPSTLNERELHVLNAMSGKGAMSLMDIMDSVDGLWVIDKELKSLIDVGAVKCASLTPTDVMVYLKMFELGSYDAARAGIHAISEKLGMTEGQAAVAVFEEIKTKIAEAIMTKMLNDQMVNWHGNGADLLIRRMVTLNHDDAMNMRPSFKIPIIGIGAPSKHIMSDLSKRLGSIVEFPEDNDVGNAVGAICSKMTESLSANVIPTPDYRYLTTIPFMGTAYHTHLGNAVSSCVRSLETYLSNKLKSSGARNIETFSKIKTFMASEGGVGYSDDKHTGTVTYVDIISRAIGDPPESD